MKQAKRKELVILSLGGSIIVPGAIDTVFLRRFRSFIKANLRRFRFVIVTGGGKINRRYNQAARAVAKVTPDDLDWIGIMATRLNAELVRSLFGPLAEPKVLVKFTQPVPFRRPIMLAAGDAPGSSSDDDAVAAARLFSARRVINLSNIDFAYDRDPKKFETARPIKAIAWPDFLKIVGSRWVPRLHAPFDPVASRAAQKLGLEVVITNGRDLKNLQRILNGQAFKGTLVK